MRIRTFLAFIFIFLVWYAIYQMFFGFIINISFVLSVATVVWLIRKVKGIKKAIAREPRKQKRLSLRRAT